MNFNTLKYYIIDALKSLKRNRTISLASIATVAGTLFIMGIFIMLAKNINLEINSVESKTQIKVFLKDDISNTDLENIKEKLSNTSGIKSFQLEDKSEALTKFNKQVSQKDSSLLNDYNSSNNPLPNSYVVTLENLESMQQVVDSIKDMPGIETVSSDEGLTNKLISISKGLRWVGVTLFILMSAVSIFLISNTIKLTIYSRRKEIEIMKYIGSTDWFIRWPFMIEGAVIGLFGAISANILVYYLYKVIFAKANENLVFLNILSPSYITQTLQWQFILVGIFVGGIGSLWSLFKFLRA